MSTNNDLTKDLSAKQLALLAKLAKEKKYAGGSTQSTTDKQPQAAHAAIKPIVRTEEFPDNLFPPSFGQERLWFFEQFDPDSSLYHEPFPYRISGALDYVALEKSLNAIIARHEVLRTVFVTIQDKPWQKILPELTISLSIVNLDHLSDAEQQEQAFRLAHQEIKAPMSLESGPLLRAALFRLRENEHILFMTRHHIVTDGWSVGIFAKELSFFYKTYCNNDSQTVLPELPIQYIDYTIWQRQQMQGQNFAAQLDYWRKQLAGTTGALDLPTDYPRPSVQAYTGAERRGEISLDLTNALKNLSRQEGATLFMTLFAAFQTLLYRYTRQPDISVATMLSNRTRIETEATIGFLANTLILRSDLSGSPTFVEFLQHVKETALDAYANQELPFDALVNALNPKRDISRNVLFDALFIFQNVPVAMPAIPGLTFTDWDYKLSRAFCDLAISVFENEVGLYAVWEYNADLFDESTIGRMIGHYQQLLTEIVLNPQQTISDLHLLTETERRQVLLDWNDTRSDYPKDKCIHQLFEEQAERTPLNIAISFEGQSLTYQQLNERANQLAHYLQEHGVGPEALVAVCVERSPDMLIALLGVLKAGGAYVPLDPDYPAQRIAYILADAQVKTLITHSHLLHSLPDSQAASVCLDTDWTAIARTNAQPPAPVHHPDHLAYTIYTSGSTGNPKGVQVLHRAVVNFLNSMRRSPGITSEDVLLAVTTLSFDIAALEILLPLTVGARVEIVRRDTAQDPEQLLNSLLASGATIMQATPITWKMLLENNRLDAIHLKVLCGGEALPPDLAQSLAQRSAELWNLYGPTETTIWSAQKRLLPGDPVTIGRPIDNTQLYILDRAFQPVPIGVSGELCIGGDGLARGYLNRPDLTAEKFIPNPFSAEPGARMYRTGDLARRLPASRGDIEFLGRIDHQVKIRGFRIELGEIEAVLSQHPDVRASVVLAREDTPGDKRLVAYLITHQERSIQTGELRAHLKDKLPEYMLPSAFVFLEALPLTPNGKLDRKALPAPDASQTTRGYVAPSTPTEETLANIWAEVLKLDKVGIHDNFFELGGHSLLATQVISRLRKTYQLDLPVRSLFEAPTLAELAASTEAARLLQSGHELIQILPVSRDQPQPLSFAQERLWFLDQLEGSNATYNIPVALRLKGDLNPDALEKALAGIIQRHEILRTVFMTVADQPVQQIIPHPAFSLPVTDLSSLAQDTQAEQARQLMAREAQQPFDLSQDPLLRAGLLRLSQHEHILLLNMHHIVSDGWSLSIIINELASLYAAFLADLSLAPDRGSSLPELPIQYVDFAAWQRAWLQGENLEKQLNYWKSQLAAAPALLELPSDRPRPAIQTFHGKTIGFELDPQLAQAIKTLSRQHNATLFMTLYAAFAVLLSRYSRQDDIVIGSPIANRNRAEIEPLIGFFVNTLALRVNLSGDPAFIDLLQQAQRTTLDAYTHQDLPFEKLVAELHPERTLSYVPIFQVMFDLQNAPDEGLHMPGLDISYEDFENTIAKFDLTLSMAETGQDLAGSFEYNTDLFDEATIRHMIDHWRTLLNGIVSNPNEKVASLPLLTEAERQQIVVEWNDTRAEYPQHTCIHQLFEEQVKRTPKNIAVSFDGQSLTYQELNQRANQLAHYLQKYGVGPDVLVGICMERSIEMVIGLLGILKTGGAYLPLDPAYPQNRLEFMLAESEPTVLLTQSPHIEKFPNYSQCIVCADADWEAITQENTANLSQVVMGTNLAYIIYTSGSTGQPKGVMIQHRSMVNYCQGAAVAYAMYPSDRVLQFASLSFDTSVEEIYPCLISGATLVLRTEAMINSMSFFLQKCQEWSLTILNLPTAFWHELMVELKSDQLTMPPSLRLMIIGGEGVLSERVSWWKKFVPSEISLVNTYGATEATAVTTIDWLLAEQKTHTASIGQPTTNVQVFILDSHLRLVPAGIPGELYIGGDGLARGYFNRPGLTAEKFVPNPFSVEPGARMYRTGDLARWLPASRGNIEYLGRIDHQVKIRGFRIELGEIEAILGQHPDIRENVLLAWEDTPGDKRLAAYIVSHSGKVIETSELRAHLKGRLPEYMIPSAFVFLETLPLTPNRKLNRRALPAPDYNPVASGYVAPSNPTEEILSNIWAEVLKVEQVGSHDNFFDLGGHSLLATQVISRLRKAFQVEMPVRSLFESPILNDLARVIEAVTGQTLPGIPVTSREYPIPLSFAQERLWFLDQLEGGSTTYNIPFGFRLQGRLNTNVLEKALAEIVRRHEVLRTVFVTVNDTPVQQIISNPSFSLLVIDGSALAPDEQAKQVRHLITGEAEWPFDLARGPLLRASLLKTSEHDHILVLNTHHIISDGWSTGIITNELESLYAAFLADLPSPLPELPIQYADFAAWQRTWLQGENLDRQLNYWKNQLAAAPALLELPSDRPRPVIQTFYGKTIGFELDPQLTGAIKTLSRQHNTTLFMTLYAAFAVLLSRYSRQDDIVIGSPIANRNRAEIETLAGFFVNSLALRADLSANPSFSDLLRQAQRTTLDAYAHQDLPFEKLVAELRPERTLSYAPVFQVMFVLQNAPDEGLQIPGLEVSYLDFENTIAKFDLTLSMAETGQSLAGAFEFNTNLFDEATIQRMIVHWQTLLNGIVSNPNERVASLPILTEAERQQVLVEWNDTHADYPKDKLIHQIFEEQAERTPENIAVSFEGQSLTYRELNERANQLAHYLQKHGVGPDTPVGISVERSLEMVIGVLGVLKAGGAYLPIDPEYPPERIAFTLADSQTNILLTQQHLLKPITGCEYTIFLDKDGTAFVNESTKNPESGVCAGNLAYIIYTSGSTGRPKGSMITHLNVTRLLFATDAWFHFGPADVWTLFHSFSFDFSVWELWGALAYGGRLVVVPYLVSRSPGEFYELLCRTGATVLNQTPSAFRQLIAAQSDLPALQHQLRTVVFGGEALEPVMLRPWYSDLRNQATRLINMYGITETTVHVTYRPLEAADTERTGASPIGFAIPDLKIYILDAWLQPVPVGVAGEMFVGGAGSARGYLNRPDLTAEKFIPNPFSAEPGARMYRTGDLARRLPASRGDIEFLGRIDQQVKIRGFRIELGEIEAVLSQHPDVRASVVLAHEDTPGDKRLVAYLVTHQEKSIQTGELRAHLKEKLPEYMLPSAFVFLEALPLTPNGKLDRKALPAPDASLLTSGYVAPGTPTEELLANIWAEVLKLDKVGIHDNFFELGGHSLLAVTLVERMRRAGFHTQVRVLFQSPTIRELSHKLTGESRAIVVPPNLIPDGCAHITPEMLPLVALTPRQIELVVSSVAGAAANVQDIYPLAPLQEGILFHHIMAEKGDPYLLKTVYSFDTHEHLERYLTALQAVIDRHDILRTGIVWEGLEQPIQVVWRNAPIVVEYLALDPTQADIAQQLQERFDPRHTRLDVTQVPLKHFFVAEDQPHQRWVMLELSHHLIEDNTSLRYYQAELQAYLLGAKQFAEPVPFRNYVAQVRLGVSQAEHEAFFRNMLGDVDQPTTPFGLTNVLGDGSGIVEAWKQVDPDLAIRLRKTARDLGVTPANLFHLAWALVLAKVSGRDDVVFGTVLFGRLQGEEDAGQVRGMTVNTLPVRIQVGNDSALDGVRKTHRTLTQLIQHEYASLSLAQRCSGVTAPTPLFTAILNYRHIRETVPPDSQEQERAAKAWQGIQVLTGEERTNYPFSMSVDDLGDGFQLDVQVAASIDPNRVCEFTHRALERLIETLENTPDTPLCQLDILPEAERRQVLLDWNDTRSDYPKDKCIHQLFEEQAERTPLNIAVSFEGQSLTYQQLNERANQLAHYLQEHGVGPDVLVGICMERSLEIVVGLLAILKAGGAYLPIDANYPQARIDFMLKDAAIKVVLTQSHLSQFLPTNIENLLCLDTNWPNIPAQSAANFPDCPDPIHLAYAMYTSGTTGVPKAVCVTHRNVVRLVMETNFARFSAQETFLQFAPISFDASTLEIWGALLHGARLLIAPRHTLSLAELGETIQTHRVGFLWLTAALFVQMVDYHIEYLQDVRQLLAGGDVLSPSHVKKLALAAPDCQIINGYGPTENTTFTACFQVTEDSLTKVSLPIGRAISNTQIYLLNEHLQPVPVGIPGELYTAGDGLARGYLNRPDLTAEKFIPNPFSAEPGARMYRTGDLARWLPDGDIEFLGRIDQQVKIRGFRIELGEIEAVLSQHPDVRASVVLAREDIPGDKRLVAYLVTHQERSIQTGELRAHLKDKLPEYMLPSAFVFLEALPLTPNGKLDRKALPAPDASLRTSGYVAPGTPTEELLANIWAEVLKLDKVGIHDNFFELGGHSLLATQVISRLRKAFQLDLPVRSLFEAPTLADLAGSVEAARLLQSGHELVQILPVPRDQPQLLSFAQERLWFLDQLEGGSATYNIPVALRLKGSLDPSALEMALAGIIQRHEVLRTLFVTTADEPIQQIISNPAFSLPVTDLSSLTQDAQAEQLSQLIAREAQQPFDLAQGPLLRASLLRLSQHEHILLLNMHHIVSDGWSIGILINELTQLYLAGSVGSSPLPELPIQYADFAAWQRTWLQGENLDRQLNYWKNQLAAAPALLELPSDHPRPAIQTFHGKTTGFELDPQLAQAIKTLSRQHNTTLFMTLYAAFAVLLSRYSRQDDIVIGSPIANRNRAEIEPLIGFFVNTLALRADLSANPSFSDLLRQAQRTTLDAYAHQDLPFEKLVAELHPDRTLSHSPIFQVMFALQNAPDGELQMPGLDISFEDFENTIAKFDLTLSMAETGQSLAGAFEFNTNLFDEATIQRMIVHWQTLLNGIVSNPNERVASLPILTEAERQQVLVEWNDTHADYPKDKLIHQIFEEQAERTPENIAVSFEGQSLTYRELNERANQLAHYLQKHGVGPDTPVGISVERSLEMVIGVLGVLKAGGAYLPIDPEYPPERIAFTLADSQTNILLTQQHLLKPITGCEYTIFLDKDGTAFVNESTKNPESGVCAGNLAYIIYTSGSTGRPKGSMITHLNVTRLLFATDAWFHFGPADVWTLFHSFSFDFSVWELWGALAYGGRLVVVPYLVSRSPGEFYELLCRTGATVLNQTPSAFRQLIAAQSDLPALQHQLRTVVFGGEALEPVMLRPWYSDLRNQATRLINMYGITETTVHVTYRPLEAADTERTGASPIGFAIPDLKIYILDAWLQPVPVGVAGEMFVGGAGSARGYLNRPDLTAEKFIPNPFSAEPGARMYRTGDLARRLPASRGDIEFLGRIDQQVKIRGFRIELGEIEAVLSQHPDVRASVVLAHEDTPGDKRLVAYLVTHQEKSIQTGELRAHLKEKLPDYMLPSAFVFLEALPLTPNGKLDRKALPAPDASLLTSGYVAPGTPTEELLANIWAEVLKLDKVGIHDNFFELGGHSLLATQVISRLRNVFQIDLPLRSLFETPTPADLALSINNIKRRIEQIQTRKLSLSTQDKEEGEL